MIVVTGATGFLGNAVARALLSRGEAVLATGRDLKRLSSLSALGASTLAADLRDDDSARQILTQATRGKTNSLKIVHCAALSAAFGSYEAFERNNVEATLYLAEEAARLRAARFVHISSPAVCFAYQDRLGIRETDELPDPVNHYARSKDTSERIVLDLLYGQAIILRPRAVYGNGDAALLPRLINAVHGGKLPLFRGGTAKTQLTHIDDVVRAILIALDTSNGSLANKAVGNVFNIAGAEEILLKDLIDRIAADLSLPLHWRPMPVWLGRLAARSLELCHLALRSDTEPRLTSYSVGILAYSQTLDTSKARRLLGWQPQVSFADGYARVMEEILG